MKKIMIVDDEPSVRTTLKLVLESEGYSTLETSNADECWKELQKTAPDLILLDIMMPGMPPAELVKKIKKDAKLKAVKIIYVTAVMGAKKLAENMEGVECTIEKPFKNEELLAKVKEVLAD